MTGIAELKAALRQQALALRDACDPALGALLAFHAQQAIDIPDGASVAGVWPLGGEIDLRPLLHALHDAGHPILLPETTKRGNPLIFRHWHPGARMIEERFGTFRPDGLVGVPDVIFVPLLAFDRAGNRLGYGGGYYDRTLALLPGRMAIGYGFAAQEMDSLPAEPHDHRLDAIVTERGLVPLDYPQLRPR